MGYVDGSNNNVNPLQSVRILLQTVQNGVYNVHKIRFQDNVDYLNVKISIYLLNF